MLYFNSPTKDTVKNLKWYNNYCNTHTFNSSQATGSENQVSLIATSGVRGFLLNITEAMEDVRITLLIEGTFAHDWRTLSVPFTAGSIICDWNIRNAKVGFVGNLT